MISTKLPQAHPPVMTLSVIVLTLFMGAAATRPASADQGKNGACPNVNQLGTFLTAGNVAASFSNSGNTTTYTFLSLTDQSPGNNVPGLVKYCVYPVAAQQPTALTVTPAGWVAGSDSTDFMFARPSGNKTNIPLDGTVTVIGTATWSTLPTSQLILLHIADSATCASLYGAGTSNTCFVKPSPAASCILGDSTGAYNAIPFGSVNCAPPSLGVEGYGFTEIGDEVTLAGSARELVSLNVLFTSWGCESGSWFDGTCSTTPGATFDVPITATVYAGDTCTQGGCVPGTQLAKVTSLVSVPYRPSADTVKCAGADAGKWFNPSGNGGAGRCQNSVATLLTFNFPSGISLPDNVIWTVAYNSSHSGYTPLGEATTCYASSGGCGYDSLNVGVNSYPGAPYAGTDVSEAVVFLSWYSGVGYPTNYPPPYGSGVLTPAAGVESVIGNDSLPQITSWIGYRPLGMIVAK